MLHEVHPLHVLPRVTYFGVWGGGVELWVLSIMRNLERHIYIYIDIVLISLILIQAPAWVIKPGPCHNIKTVFPVFPGMGFPF